MGLWALKGCFSLVEIMGMKQKQQGLTRQSLDTNTKPRGKLKQVGCVVRDERTRKIYFENTTPESYDQTKCL